MMDEISRAASALSHLDAGCPREAWVRAGMAAKAAGLSFDAFHEWSASGANYAGEHECRIAWKSFKQGGRITASTLFAMAYAQGWQEPQKRLHTANGSRINTRIAVSRKAPVTPIRPPQDAADVWERCAPVPAHHAYLVRKGGLPDGLRVYPEEAPPLIIRGQNVAGYLVVPCRDMHGDLNTLQFIPPLGGNKLNLPGAVFGAGCHLVGEITDCVYVVEGIGQAWAVHAATGAAVAVCFGAGRMATVAAALRERYPAVRLILVPDRGQESRAVAIAADLKCEWVVLPADRPANYDVNDYALECGADLLATLLTGTQMPPKPEPRFRLLSAADLHLLPPLQWRVRGVLPAQGLAGLYGPSASGKSFLAFDMAAAIAEGMPWFDCRVEAAPVVYVALEGEAGFRQRAAAWETHQGRALPEDVHLVLQPFQLTTAQDVEDLATVVPAGAVVFIDTLNRAAPTADENSSRDMGEILSAAKALQARTQGLVVLVHHTGKDASRGLRGHSSLFAALDAAIEVARDGERRTWRVAKAKDGADGETHSFALHVESLGLDAHGDVETSCVVVRDLAAQNIKRVKLPQGGNQKIAFQALSPLFQKEGKAGKPGAPAFAPCLSLEVAINHVAAALTVTPDRKTERAREAITGLVGRGVLGCHDGWIWLI